MVTTSRFYVAGPGLSVVSCHYCPAYFVLTCCKFISGDGLELFRGVHDLKVILPICEACRFELPGVTHERRQDAVRADHGVRTMEDVWTDHRAASRRRRGADPGLRRGVSHHGLRAAHLARVAARHQIGRAH